MEQDLSEIVYIVITSVPQTVNASGKVYTGNLANDLYYKDGKGEIVVAENVYLTFPAIGTCLTEVFQPGQLLVCWKATGREISYPGRKPSKWDIKYEMFEDMKMAIIKCLEIQKKLSNK